MKNLLKKIFLVTFSVSLMNLTANASGTTPPPPPAPPKPPTGTSTTPPPISPLDNMQLMPIW